MMRLFPIIFSLIFLSLSSCLAPSEKKKGDQVYFDLKGYFEKEAKRLNANKLLRFEKAISYEAKEETRTISEIDWNEELSMFFSYDLNKAAYLGKFQIDSVEKEGQLFINYSALDKKINVKSLSIVKNPDGSIEQITIDEAGKNSLHRFEKKLTYNPSTGYSVQGEQKTLTSGKRQFSIKVEFVSAQTAFYMTHSVTLF
jgi:hypothetical protein